MGNCVQCYPCFIKSNINNQQSSINIPPIINETENNEQHNNYKHYLSDNNLNTNEIKKQINIDKILNYGPTLEKNEGEENVSPNNNNNEDNTKPKNNNLLHLKKDANQNRRRSILSEFHQINNNKYSKLKSFSRQLSTESFLRAKTKGDKIINDIPKELGPKQIGWGGAGGLSSKFNSIFGRSSGDMTSYSVKYNQYLKKITEQAEEKKIKRLSVINEDETEEDKGNSTVIMKDRLNYNNKLVNKLKNVFVIRNNLDDIQINNLSLLINEYEINADLDIFCKGEIGNSLFILDSGELKLYNNNPNKYISIKDEYSFGEVCLMYNEEIKRRYYISSLTKTKLFILEREKFNLFLTRENIKIKTVDTKTFKNIDFFKDFPDEQLHLLSKLCFIMNENECKINKLKLNFVTMKEFFNLEIKSCLIKHCIKIDLNIKNNKNKEDINNKDNINNNDNPKIKQKNEKQYLIIPINTLFELFGFDVKKKVV